MLREKSPNPVSKMTSLWGDCQRAPFDPFTCHFSAHEASPYRKRQKKIPSRLGFGKIENLFASSGSVVIFLKSVSFARIF